MLVNMKELLEVAQKETFAIPAFNIGSDFLLKSVIEEAEKNNAPLILSMHPDEIKFSGEEFAKYVVNVASKSVLPIVVHLDHGSNKEEVLTAVRCGFSSVMIDASHSSIEENIKITKEVVDICKLLNVSVEAELGTIGNNDGSFEGTTKDILYTRPEDVELFIGKTNVDTLAIAIGTAHGIYPDNMKPKLRIDILEEIRKVTDIPLVLHGGSNNHDEEIKESISKGIQKINISSDYKKAFYLKTQELLMENLLYEPNQLYGECMNEAKKVISEKMNLMGCIDKATLYHK